MKKRVVHTSYGGDEFRLRVEDHALWAWTLDYLWDWLDLCCRRPFCWIPGWGPRFWPTLGYRTLQFVGSLDWKREKLILEIPITSEQALAVNPHWDEDRWLWDPEHPDNKDEE